VNESAIETSPVFPQPITGLSSFPYHLNGAVQAELIIHNAAGQAVEQRTLRAQHGVVYLQASDYPAGMYILSIITDEGQRVSEQFLVQ
jgi:hypothetical protein